jgi:hypothetical protein
MDEPRFDPGGFWEFHLSGGAVRTRAGRRVVVLPEDVAAPLLRLALAQGDARLLTHLGAALGAEAMDTLGGDVEARSPETVVGHLKSVVALFGLGRLSLERWGDALVVTLDGAPPLPADALGALLSGLFGALGEAEARCVPTQDGRFVIVHADAVATVRAWAAEGAGPGMIAARLAPSGGAS